MEGLSEGGLESWLLVNDLELLLACLHLGDVQDQVREGVEGLLDVLNVKAESF